MNRSFRTGVAVALASLLGPGLAVAQQGLSQRDGRGPVAVTITLIEVPARSCPDWCGKEKWRILPEG